MRGVVIASSVAFSQADPFPDCIMKGKVMRGLGEYSLFTDVSPFGLSGCFLENCQDSDKWISPSEAVCAESCGRVPGCTHWSYGKEAGHTKCWLRTSDTGAEDSAEHVSGESTCLPPDYPTCIKGQTRYQAVGEPTMYNLSPLAKTIGCLNDDCSNTNRYLSPSRDDCATSCAQMGDCRHHSFGNSDEGPLCELFGQEVTEVADTNWDSGFVGCAPITAWEAPLIQQAPANLAVAPGNTGCWSGGFSFELCCAHHHGPYGNPQCWDSALYTFDRCCFDQNKDQEM